jgi:hypothetical protein
MKKQYTSPKLVVYGGIADHTFVTPHGNVKGCTTVCHLDSFAENSATGAGS